MRKIVDVKLSMTRSLLLIIGIGFQLGLNVCLAESLGANAEQDTTVGLQSPAFDDNKLTDNCIAEVIGIHQFFEAWFKGTIERTPENYARATSALLNEFSQITPDGRYWEREALMPKLEESYGLYSESDPPFRLWIKDPRAIRLEGGDFCLCIYEEWRQIDGIERGYVTTAILKRFADAPNGVKWLHLQETWLPATEGE